MNKQVVLGGPFPTYNAMSHIKVYLSETYFRMNLRTLQRGYFCGNRQMNDCNSALQICFLAYSKFV